MESNTFNGLFWKSLSIFLAFALVVCFFPFLFTQFSVIDFTETGQIGDTIGGIIGPFIAIAAAILTFLAFWVQFVANEQLRKDIKLDHFENRFYKMLDIHVQNVNNLQFKETTGRQVPQELYLEFSRIFDIIDRIIRNRDLIKLADLQCACQITNEEDCIMKVSTSLAYGYYFYGIDFFLSDSNELSKINNIIHERIKHHDFIPVNETLGHYYRHIFHIIKYLSSQNEQLIPENKKYEYAKLLRAQMSDYEQILLYYNSLSPVGLEWNKSLNDSSGDYRINMGYIARFRMIKNIPRTKQYKGWIPKKQYEREISVYEQHGVFFFEHNKY